MTCLNIAIKNCNVFVILMLQKRNKTLKNIDNTENITYDNDFSFLTFYNTDDIIGSY